MINPEEVMLRALRHAGFDAAADVPQERPERFVSFEMTGCRVTQVVVKRPTFAIQCWAPTRAEASQMASEVADSVQKMLEIGEIAGMSVESVYNYPLEGQPRYQVVVDCVMRP